MLNRRHLLQSGALSLLVACAEAQTLPGATPAQTEGPFYPLDTGIERDTDLTRLSHTSARAAGQIIEVRGRVTDPSGAPLSGASLELWQANAAGRYAHPGDNNSAPLDPNFQGYARLRTGADGAFEVVTVMPGGYGRRTPHLHWKIAAGGGSLTTQMYFPSEARNETDSILRNAGNARALIAETAPAREVGALGYFWSIVMPLQG